MTLNDRPRSAIDIVVLIRFNGSCITCISIRGKFREARNSIKVGMLLLRMPEGF